VAPKSLENSSLTGSADELSVEHPTLILKKKEKNDTDYPRATSLEIIHYVIIL
jgi:hypothetical protein